MDWKPGLSFVLAFASVSSATLLPLQPGADTRLPPSQGADSGINGRLLGQCAYVPMVLNNSH